MERMTFGLSICRKIMKRVGEYCGWYYKLVSPALFPLFPSNIFAPLLRIATPDSNANGDKISDSTIAVGASQKVGPDNKSSSEGKDGGKVKAPEPRAAKGRGLGAEWGTSNRAYSVVRVRGGLTPTIYCCFPLGMQHQAPETEVSATAREL